MGAAAIIAAIATAVSVLVSLGVTVNQTYANIKNQNLRAAIRDLTSKITSELKSGRLNVNRLLALLNNKNTAALQQYLYANPLVSKSFSDIQQDADVIASLQAEANNLENLINSYANELSSLGYSQTAMGTKDEQTKAKDVQSKLDKAKQDYLQLEDRIRNTDVSIHRPFVVDTSHLDAVSQNISGGMK